MSLYITADGSHTVISPKFKVPYHSTHGALQETDHVFIDNGLLRCKSNSLSILEIGLGTGLNALATFRTNQSLMKKIHYDAIEAFPLGQEVLSQLNYRSFFSESEILAFDRIHSTSWGVATDLDPAFTFTKYQCKLEVWNSILKYDLIYFDAFAPTAQPELWTTEIFQKLYDMMVPDAALVTYCAKGQVKRDLRSIGFNVESPPGPTGKREMTRAVK